jgi:hypothetical protein
MEDKINAIAISIYSIDRKMERMNMLLERIAKAIEKVI